MIKPWVFEFVPEPSDGSAGPDYFRQYVDLWARDEELGFEGVFFSEHHFGGSFSSCPHLLVAATAMRTRRLRLGVMGVVTAWYQPLRLLEEIGLLDQLSGGRFEIGVSVGVPQELARLNISMEQARAINEETLEILERALPVARLDHQGERFSYRDLRVLPPVVQRPRPPLWTTIVSEGSARGAARRGRRITTGFHGQDKVAGIFDAYREEADRAGFAGGPDMLGLRRRVVVAETRARAKEMSDAVIERYRQFTASDSRMKLAAIPDETKGKDAFEISADEFIEGTPADVAENIVAQCRLTGAGHFLAVLHWSAGFDEVRAAHELFGSDVIPALRSASIGP